MFSENTVWPTGRKFILEACAIATQRHALIMLASAYAASDPRFAMAVPVLTGMAGVSAPPAGLTRVGAASLVAACSLVGLMAAWIA